MTADAIIVGNGSDKVTLIYSTVCGYAVTAQLFRGNGKIRLSYPSQSNKAIIDFSHCLCGDVFPVLRKYSVIVLGFEELTSFPDALMIFYIYKLNMSKTIVCYFFRGIL